MRTKLRLTLFIVTLFAPALLFAQEVEPRILPGVQKPGHILLPTQWSLRPAGKQLKLGDFPVNIALHPTEPYAAILHAGFGDHEVQIIDLKTQTIVSIARIPQAFYGVHFGPQGNFLFVSGGEYEVVHRFRFAEGGYLTERKELKLGDVTKDKLVPAGISSSADGETLYVACGWGFKLAMLPWSGEKVEFIDFPKDSYPYATLPTIDNQRVYVSLWGAAGVAVVDLAKKEIAATWQTSSHPTEMKLSPDESLLYVACANSNSVHVIDTKSGETLEVISSALYPKANVGSTPNSLALSKDGKVLLIANADNNNVAMFNVSERGRSQSLGYIPVGWYPTSVRFDPRNENILVSNGKGLMSQANPQGPKPGADPPATVKEYIGGLFRGTLSFIAAPSPVDMAKYTRLAYACSPLQEGDAVVTPATRTKDNPIPAKVGDPSPIKHCIYIIKENRTYDQVFGDLKQGNGDPNLCLFPRNVTPNHHALAEQFVLLDNFYVESEVSADGHEWSMAAYATDFVEKSWPLSYRGGKGKLTYPSEGAFEIARSSGGYIWDRCAEAKVSYRSYGEFISNPKKIGEPATARVKSLEGHFDPYFHGYDLDYSDQKRADRFIEELARFEKEGELPQFIVLRLPNDHTYGTTIGKHTPTAMVADNDLALGRVVEAVSNSKFWKETAIFVVQDDAQNGSDHVDAHRTVALVVSPYTKRKFVDSSMYSTASMLRSMELILGLKPMSQYDAAALPMFHSFQAEPNLAAYKHLPAQVDLNELNMPGAFGADISRKLDFSKEDVADDLLLNEVVWRSVRGKDSKMPAPVRASFVFTHPEEDEDDDDDDD